MEIDVLEFIDLFRKKKITYKTYTTRTVQRSCLNNTHTRRENNTSLDLSYVWYKYEQKLTPGIYERLKNYSNIRLTILITYIEI